MRIILGSLMSLCLACGQSAEEMSPGGDSPETVEDVASEPDSGTSQPAGAPLDPSKAKAFLSYQEKLLPFLKSMQQPNTARFGENVEALDAAREAAGLSDADVSALMEIEAAVLARSAGSGSAVQIEELEASLETMDSALRPDAERSLDEMKQARDDLMNMTELRAMYGDPIVDAMIALQPELARQFEGISEAR
jgi:hypothetical protein